MNKPNCPPDVRLIAVDEVLRRLTSKSCVIKSNIRPQNCFTPSNLGWLAHEVLKNCPSTKVLHWRPLGRQHLRDAQSWYDQCFQPCFKASCTGWVCPAFPRVTCLDYGQHPILWHSLGSLTSQTGVQQGDPLGPFMFAIVLQRMVTIIHTDGACAGLLGIWMMVAWRVNLHQYWEP